MWWGYSEALDLQEEVKAVRNKENGDGDQIDQTEELNILIIGNGDGRHILKTLSKAYTHPKKQVNFFVVEPTLELYARQLMLFSIALEPPEKLGLLEKTRIFMEVYGNTLLRPTTSAYLSRKSIYLIDVVTRFGTASPLVNFDKLRYNERDNLEQVFHFWRNGARDFVITKLWDARLRRHLGTRYDSRVGTFDWDYYMRLHPMGGAIVSKHEYMYFRQYGVSFTWLETDFSKANPTLASGIVRVGGRFVHHGYIGDTMMGAYAPYGMHCEDPEMLKTTQGTYMKRATDITERNLMRLMSEIEKNEKYVHAKTDFDVENLGVVITEVTDLQSDADADVVTPKLKSKSKDEERKADAIEVQNARVTFLPTTSLKQMDNMVMKYSGMFDVISVAQYMDVNVDDKLLKLGRDEPLLLMEGKLFVLGYNKEEILKKEDELSQKINGLVDFKCERLKEFDPLKDRIGRFRVVHKSKPTSSA